MWNCTWTMSPALLADQNTVVNKDPVLALESSWAWTGAVPLAGHMLLYTEQNKSACSYTITSPLPIAAQYCSDNSALPLPGLSVQAQGQKAPKRPAIPGEIPPGSTQLPLQHHQKHAALQHRCALILWIALCSFRCSWLIELQTEGSHGSVPGLGAHLQPKHLLTLWVTNRTEKESVPVRLP